MNIKHFYCAFALVITFVSCSTLQRPVPDDLVLLEEPFEASYDHTWTSTLKVLDEFDYKYPDANKDAGYIETAFKKGPSHRHFYYSGGQRIPKEARWKMRIWLVKLQDTTKGDITLLRLEKEEQVSEGVLDTWSAILTDLLEEKKLFYRVHRQLELLGLTEDIRTPSD